MRRCWPPVSTARRPGLARRSSVCRSRRWSSGDPRSHRFPRHRHCKDESTLLAPPLPPENRGSATDRSLQAQAASLSTSRGSSSTRSRVAYSRAAGKRTELQPETDFIGAPGAALSRQRRARARSGRSAGDPTNSGSRIGYAPAGPSRQGRCSARPLRPDPRRQALRTSQGKAHATRPIPHHHLPHADALS